MATRKVVKKNSYTFPVIVTESEGQLVATVGEVTGNMDDELNVREYIEHMANTYFDFLDSIDVEGDVDDDYVDEEEPEPEPLPLKRKPTPRK
jgi:hypothetical protein